MTDAQKRFVELEKKKDEIKKYYEDLALAISDVVEEGGIGVHFQDNEGIVYQMVVPDGTFVKFEKLSYNRTRRGSERAGNLSLKKAKELGYEVE